jgi:hypothetical protein
MTQMFKLLILTVALPSLVGAAGSAEERRSDDTDDFKVMMVNETVISRDYPNDMYDTASIRKQCSDLQGTLLKGQARVNDDIRANAGVCRYPKVVKISEHQHESSENVVKAPRYIYQAVVSLEFPSGSITPEPISDQCESRGGILIHKKSESSGRSFATFVRGGVCRIAIDELSDSPKD